MMETFDLGGTRASRIAFGGAPMSGYDYGSVDRDESIAALREALDRGINLFDVADIYGFGGAEEILGQALSGRRERAVIATKFGLRPGENGVERDASARWITSALDASLARLQTDRIDLYQLHWPDPKTPIEETAEALRRCLQSGKVRFIGCSNLSLQDAQRLHAHVGLAALQVPFNLLCREAAESVVPWCAANGVAVLAHSPLARGLLGGRRAIDEHFASDDTRSRSGYFSAENADAKERLLESIRRIATEHGCSAGSVAVRWVLDQPGITAALVGIKNRSQLADHAAVSALRMSDDEKNELSSLSEGIPGVMSGDLAHAVKPLYSRERS